MNPAWPTDKNGICYPLEALDPPETHLEGKNYQETNHHYGFTKTVMSRLAIYTVFRNLDCNQAQFPMDVHDWAHRKFSQPELLRPVQALDKIMEQFAIGGLIRIGSARNPEYKKITDSTILKVKHEYDVIRHMI